MNFKFYIFGVPKIFDLYHGNAENLSYFQQFYDESNKEDTKLTIHRKANGEVSYLYLKHNLLTAEDRKNSFFGMSVVFNNEYIFDVISLQKLFDAVYETILKNKLLLAEVKGNPNVQAKFLVRSFVEAESEVKRIENIIYKNLTSEFANDVRKIDIYFKEGKANLMRKMNDKKSNSDVLAALRTYTWVSLSPEYKEEIDEISKDGIEAFNINAEKIKNSIIELYKQFSMRKEVESVRENISKLEGVTNSTLKTIRYYLKNQLELKPLEQKYTEIQKQLFDLNIAVGGSTTQSPLPPSPNTIFSFTLKDKTYHNIDKLLFALEFGLKTEDKNRIIEGCNKVISWQTSTPEQKKKAAEIKKQVKTNIKIPIVIKKYWWVAAVLIVGVLLSVFYPYKPNFPDTEQYNKFVAEGSALLRRTPFNLKNIDNAKEKFNSAKNLTVKTNTAQDSITSANKMAIQYIINQADIEFNKGGTGSTRKIDGYNNAENKLKIITQNQYGTENDYKDKIKEYEQQTKDYYFEHIRNATHKEIIEYCNIILQLDPNNADAKAKLNAAEELLRPPPKKLIDTQTKTTKTNKSTEQEKAHPSSRGA